MSCNEFRAHALQRLAQAAASDVDTSASAFARLSRFCPELQLPQPTDKRRKKIPKVAKIEALLALCNVVQIVNSEDKARCLLKAFSSYLVDTQTLLSQDPCWQHTASSPWEELTQQLTKACLVLGLRFPSLHVTMVGALLSFLENCHSSLGRLDSTRPVTAVPFDESSDFAVVNLLSLLGFMKAAAAYLNALQYEEIVEMVQKLFVIVTPAHLHTLDVLMEVQEDTNESNTTCESLKASLNHYVVSKRPMGSLLLRSGLMALLKSASSLQVSTPDQLFTMDTIDLALCGKARARGNDHQTASELTPSLMQISSETYDSLSLDPELEVEELTPTMLLLVLLKSQSLHVYFNCLIATGQINDTKFMSWLRTTLRDPLLMADEQLARVVLKALAVCAKETPSLVPDLKQSLMAFIAQAEVRGPTIDEAAQSLYQVLALVSEDEVSTGIYLLGNVLNYKSEKFTQNGHLTTEKDEPGHQQHTTLHAMSSMISITASGEEEISAIFGNIIRAIVRVAVTCQQTKVVALAQSMLLQKMGRVNPAVDIHIIREAANFAFLGGSEEFASLLRFYDRASHEGARRSDDHLLHSVKNARMKISEEIQPGISHFRQYLSTLLETIVSKGDSHETSGHSTETDDLTAREIVELVPPLSELVSSKEVRAEVGDDEKLAKLHREAWFNVVVHKITPWSTRGKRCAKELRQLALQSEALIAESRGNQFESELELNTVLRRGMNGPNTAEQKKRLIKLLPKCEVDIRSLTYQKVIFLMSMLLVETLRAEAGDCSHILTYFVDPSLSGTAMQNCTSAVAEEVMTVYFNSTSNAGNQHSTASSVAQQLVHMFTGCCHRIRRVQQIAAASADQIIKTFPSALCQRPSIFALLELLTIMWTSCLEIELDEYELKAKYTSSRGGVSVELSDDYDHRKMTLNNLYKRARSWVTYAIDIAPLHVKGLLQTYLSDYTDDGTYGHLALGRSFAVDMGSVISAANLKLTVTDRHGECNINTASDFVAQYTSRQEYRHMDGMLGHEQQSGDPVPKDTTPPHGNSASTKLNPEVDAFIDALEQRVIDGQSIPLAELRDSLQRAAAYVSKNEDSNPRSLHQLVDIPFLIFTKQSIRLGISIWLNVTNENPSKEAMILGLVAHRWEASVRKRQGAFSNNLRHEDPFYLKEEFAATDKPTLLQMQQQAHDLIAPHLSLLQFFTSFYNANRIEDSLMQDVCFWLMQLTLQALKQTAGHPLAREFHFQVVVFALTILQHFSSISHEARWQFGDTALSAGLAWFRLAPRWSFGGNRLQIKAEMRLLKSLEVLLRNLPRALITETDAFPSLSPKVELLTLLLENEHARLNVWLSPLENDRKHILTPRFSQKGPAESAVASLLHVAWNEDPALAIHLPARFPSPHLYNEVRRLLLKYPNRVVGEPDALDILIGASLASDLSFQLRYLIYWAPVNPVTAMTYFLPEYRNDPYILQYAMRTLESHAVDVTFFYVPQLVQTLRYDVLGYVQRYIMETAQVSQLFAHQIIWNMLANSYKDEDSSVEDSLKPTLDIIRNRMIESFSGPDKDFYEKEFSFFGEITDISGKLRPFLKKSKPEKKQKIEEELRKIKVDEGVYLPCNPDGTVIGIDRKSGKPLQSHAKAPYMATFRIRKADGGVSGVEGMMRTEQKSANGVSLQTELTREVWQSAIFKVGDDCRQDILALQMIAAFRGIFNSVGLDVYVFPYRVTATAPGRGVVDVLPNTISRDMLGREAVNGLFEYFVSKYGAESSIAFQEARNNFVKSMAPYSVISYLLQFKDRHNGNIMIDSAGHILHIDFGFCFDIAPGGVRFERAPFKLTSEMVAVMGGSTSSQAFKWFEELCVKSFLAARPYAGKLCDMVVLMLGSGLPCFKPETIKHLRERFVLEKSEREAADFMRDLIKKSYSSYSTKGYDQFQLLTNGIPY